LNKITKCHEELNQVSPSFCLAKWLQVTIHLQNGQTHSCHHPVTHKIPLRELEKDPSALHNTKFKKSLRKMMLEGERPKECEYCWKMEDAHKDNLSDRTFKSSEEWAYPKLKEVAKLHWNDSISPQYVEVSFGNECNFKCAYCGPHISSSIMSEYTAFGAYSSMQELGLDELKQQGLFPYSKDEFNPYVGAFWEWWPTLSKELKVFRITGGEPLLNSNTFKFLEYLKSNPMPDLSLAINTNLGIPKATFIKFLELIKPIIQNKHIKDFQLYTSVDTHGKHAEFLRFGLNYNEFMQNVRTFLQEIPEAQLIFMCTYNVFSVVNMKKLLFDISLLKREFKNQKRQPRVLLDTPYLKDPAFLSCYILNEDWWHYIRDDLNYLKNEAKIHEDGAPIYNEYEIKKFERILNWLESLEENEHRRNSRRKFYTFINEYETRKKIKLKDYAPEYVAFHDYCKRLFLDTQ
jgi:organic radical activating enzyme